MNQVSMKSMQNPMSSLNPMSSMGGGTNLFDILVNVAFGFVAGLMVLWGPKETIDFGSKLAADVIKMIGMDQQAGGFGVAMFAPYVVIAPIAGLVVKQLTAVRSLKSFAFFAGAVAIGFAIAFLTQGYFKP